MRQTGEYILTTYRKMHHDLNEQNASSKRSEDLFKRIVDRSYNPLVMGIVNVTPDSFSDGGMHDDTASAIDHGIQLLDEGADIIDIGGESTRPPGKDYGSGSVRIDEAEEFERVIPVVSGICRRRPDAIISIDTVKSGIAEAAIAAGASIINDVSGGQYDSDIWHVAARHSVPYVMMHGHNPTSVSPVEQNVYQDVVGDVLEFLRNQSSQANMCGVKQIIIDPGIGFAKGKDDSVAIMRHLGRFGEIGLPILIGASRKSFIGRILGVSDPSDRLYGSLAAAAAAALAGAAIVRVHDVQPTVQHLRVLHELLQKGNS